MRRSVRGAIVAGAVLPLTLGLGVPGARAAGPSPGSPSAGDRLFPGLGNGGYDVRAYDLRFDYDAKTKTVDMASGVTARATKALSRFNLDFDGNTITRLTVNGRAANYRRDGKELIITPSRPIGDHAKFRVDVHYRADPRAEHNCRLVPPLTGSAWLPTSDGFGLAGQPNCMHSVYPSNDVPSDKARYRISIRAPKKLESIANGTLVSTSTSHGDVIRTYASSKPISTELVQAAVGNFAVIEHRAKNGMPIRDVVPADNATEAKPTLLKERHHLAWLTRQIGVPYPFATYGSLAIKAKFGFALETQTISLFPGGIFTSPSPSVEGVMVHELTHQWFGDLVSPATWSDVWLNEGHATWYATRYGQSQGHGTLEEAMHKTYKQGDQYRAEYGPVARPKSYKTMFSDQVYGGGALVLYALRQKVGKKTFRAIERRWLQRYANSSAGTDDFITIASRVAGRDLRSFLGRWLYDTKTPPMPGHPHWKVDPASERMPGNPGKVEELR
ncbi:MAG: M1 family metallopeptidase [Streptosporangiales bacterium]